MFSSNNPNFNDNRTNNISLNNSNNNDNNNGQCSQIPHDSFQPDLYKSSSSNGNSYYGNTGVPLFSNNYISPKKTNPAHSYYAGISDHGNVNNNGHTRNPEVFSLSIPSSKASLLRQLPSYYSFVHRSGNSKINNYYHGHQYPEINTSNNVQNGNIEIKSGNDNALNPLLRRVAANTLQVLNNLRWQQNKEKDFYNRLEQAWYDKINAVSAQQRVGMINCLAKRSVSNVNLDNVSGSNNNEGGDVDNNTNGNSYNSKSAIPSSFRQPLPKLSRWRLSTSNTPSGFINDSGINNSNNNNNVNVIGNWGGNRMVLPAFHFPDGRIIDSTSYARGHYVEFPVSVLPVRIPPPPSSLMAPLVPENNNNNVSIRRTSPSASVARSNRRGSNALGTNSNNLYINDNITGVNRITGVDGDNGLRRTRSNSSTRLSTGNFHEINSNNNNNLIGNFVNNNNHNNSFCRRRSSVVVLAPMNVGGEKEVVDVIDSVL